MFPHPGTGLSGWSLELGKLCYFNPTSIITD